MSDEQDYYQKLGIKRDATGDDILVAYRRCADGKSPIQLKHLHYVYDILSNPATRRSYDADLLRAESQVLNPFAFAVVPTRGGGMRLKKLRLAALPKRHVEIGRAAQAADVVFDPPNEKSEIEKAYDFLMTRYVNIVRGHSKERLEDWTEHAASFVENLAGKEPYQEIYQQVQWLFDHLRGRSDPNGLLCRLS